MSELYTVKEIAQVLGVTVQTVHYRIKTGGWTPTKRTGRGGGKAFLLADLPEDVRVRLRGAAAAVLVPEVVESVDGVAARTDTDTAQTGTGQGGNGVGGDLIDDCGLRPVVGAAPAVTAKVPAVGSTLLGTTPVPGEPELDARRKRVALARYDLATAYRAYVTKAEKGKGRKQAAKDAFLQLYQIGTWQQLLDLIGPKISTVTLDRWVNKIKKAKDPYVLADKRGLKGKGSTSLPEAMALEFLRVVLHPNRMKIAVCIRLFPDYLRSKGLDTENIPSEMTFRRFLKTWKTRNYDIWVFLREGAKAWNDKVAYYVERNLSQLKVGQILVADGHVLNFEVVNPFTGKPTRMMWVLWFDMASNMPLGWEIAPTENTMVIAAALRRSLMRLGKVGQIAYLDNGRAFKGTYFNDEVDFSQSGLGGVFQRIGMETIFAWAYHGQSKTIERFFSTFSELETMLPSYSGRNIETKPARMSRGERLHRELYEKSGGRALSVEEAHLVIAYWLDMYAQRPQRGHLGGRTPQEVFDAGRGDGLSDDLQIAMRECMLATDERTITRAGISIFGQNYYDQALYGRHHKAFVRYDLQDHSKIEVYDENWQFICTAVPKGKVNAAARILGNEEDQAMLKAQLHLKKAQEAAAGRTAKGLLQAEILPERQKQLETMAALPRPEKPKEDMTPPKVTEKARKRLAKAKAELAEKRKADEERGYTYPDMPFKTERERYEFLLKLEERDQISLTGDDKAFKETFEGSATYGTFVSRYDQMRDMWQRQRERAAAGLAGEQMTG